MSAMDDVDLGSWYEIELRAYIPNPTSGGWMGMSATVSASNCEECGALMVHGEPSRLHEEWHRRRKVMPP